jgi:hypothetical protein
MRNISLQGVVCEGTFLLIAKQSTSLKIKHIITIMKLYESLRVRTQGTVPFFLAMFRDVIA